MLAVVHSVYGGPEVLRLTEVPLPVLQPKDVLVKVQAVALNASDVEFLRGEPAYTRAWGLFEPKHRVLGSDVAGVVERVGDAVTHFAPGDFVFGDLLERWGGLAEYVAAPEGKWALVPQGLAPAVACSIPQAGVVAWQALQECGPVAGKRLLIIGAGGGSGTFAVQMAKLQGACRIVAVDRAAKAPALLELGADEVWSVEQENYWERGETFELIIDLVGSRPLRENWRLLAAGGSYRLVGGTVRRLLGAALLGPLISAFASKSAGVLVVQPSPKAFVDVAKLCLAGQITPCIGQRHPLHRVQEGFAALGAGQVFGKVVIELESDGDGAHAGMAPDVAAAAT